jgi:hypothetical protein
LTNSGRHKNTETVSSTFFQVYDVGESLAVPHSDDWNKFAHTLADIKQNKIEQVPMSENFSLFVLDAAAPQ